MSLTFSTVGFYLLFLYMAAINLEVEECPIGCFKTLSLILWPERDMGGKVKNIPYKVTTQKYVTF